MHNIIFGIIMSVILFPVSVFAAVGSAGSVDTLGVDVMNRGKAAQLRASVHSIGAQASVYFEYGPTSALGRSTGSRRVAANKSVLSSMLVYPIEANTVYFYRAVLEGTSGTTYGEIRSFMSNQDGTTGVSGAVESGSTSSGAVGSGTSGGGTSVSTQDSGGESGQSTNQIAAVGSAFGASTQPQSSTGGASQNPGGFFQRLFDSFTNARPIQLSVAMNPEKPEAREIIEYVVTYANMSNKTVGEGELSLVLPDSVVYLADNSGGKTTLSKVSGGQQLTFSTDQLSGKAKRSVTFMAVAGSGVAQALPTAVANITYRNAEGAVQHLATNKAVDVATPLVAAVGASSAASPASSANDSSDDSILPNSFLEWVIFLGVVTGIIVFTRKVMAIYQERKKRILEESREGLPAHA